MKQIYLDNGATTMVDPRVLKKMKHYFTVGYANASSPHRLGQDARKAVEDARKIIAASINCKPKEIIFTSGGTESNNLALKGVALANKKKGNHIITTVVDHKCILNACAWLETQGFEVTYLNVDENGFVSPKQVEEAITKKTILVSIIHGNNEIGTINNLKALGKVCREHRILFHTDACQSYTKTELDVEKQQLDLVSLNAHKIHGPKGVGALFVRAGTEIIPLNHGGGQEFGIRSGTENVHGIVGFAEAVKIGMNKNHAMRMQKLRDLLIEKILAEIPQTKLNGPRGNKRLCNNTNITFENIEGESIGAHLYLKGISVSTGSACSAKTLEPSYVLRAIGRTHEDANGSLRITLSRFSTAEEIETFIKELKPVVQKLRSFSPLEQAVKHVLG